MRLTVTNTKGGVGKTTTAVNVATGFADRGRRTLLVDLDPQAHATRCFVGGELSRDASDFIMDRPSNAAASILPSGIENLDLVPATDSLTATADLLSTRIRREERLSKALESVAGTYRHVVIDCPPVLGILAYNAIIAADLLVVPVQPGMGAVSGLDALLAAARELRQDDEVPYRILTTMFEVRTTRTNALMEELLEEHRRFLLETVISRSESLNQANLAGRPVSRHERSSRGAVEYDALCEELLRLRPRRS